MAYHNYFDVDEVISDKIPDIKPQNDDEVNADDLAAVTRLCEAVSAMIDSYCKRRPGYFAAAVYTDDELEAGTVRRYRGEGKNYLRIGNHVRGSVAITKPVVSDTRFYENENTGWLYSLDSNNGNGDDYFVTSDNFFVAGSVYEITAVWKFDQTPADIIEAGKQIISHIWDKGKGVIGEVTPSGFVIERDMPLSAKAILDGHKRRPFEVQ